MGSKTVYRPCQMQLGDRLESGNPGIWKSRNLGSKKHKFSKSKYASPKMSARFGLVGKNNSRPHLGGNFRQFFHWPEKYQNYIFLTYFPWWTNGCYAPGSDLQILKPRLLVVVLVLAVTRLPCASSKISWRNIK